MPETRVLAEWLTEQGEPFKTKGLQTLTLRALPVQLAVQDERNTVAASVSITPTLPLMRLVDLLFDLSVLTGADVHLTGHGKVTRPALWLRLADEQDRLRIAEALARATEHGNYNEIVRRLWSILAGIHPGLDIRWNANKARIVELREVGTPNGIPLNEALRLDEAATLGSLVSVPIATYLHSLGWRWLSEAYPGLV